MILRSLLGTSVSFIAFLSLPLLPVFAKKDGPTISKTKFENAFDNIFYLEDSNVILGHDSETANAWRSSDAGETWSIIKDAEGEALDVYPHPWDNQRAYILGAGTDHWITTNQGKTWSTWSSGRQAAKLSSGRPFSFHARDPKKVIWNGEECQGDFLRTCSSLSFYTEDDFAHTTTLTNDVPGGCVWAVQTPIFGEDVAEEIDNRVFCIRSGRKSIFGRDYKLMSSDDYFKSGNGIEPALDSGRTIEGILSIASVKGYMVVASRGENTDELALFVTDDTKTWSRAEFGQHRVTEEAYTILESTNYSMQVDVLGSRELNPMGHLFASNSNGTYFTKQIDYTNRNIFGNVDFEKVANIQGIYLVNTVKNAKEVLTSPLAKKQVISQISFDDGRTFQDLVADGETLHVHSVTEARMGGRIFSSPAPGIVMGVGNTGKALGDCEDGDLYVSDDAGLTWTRALKGPYLYEFGNSGAVLVAIDSEEATSTVHYSLNHGKDWEKADLDKKINVEFITTVPDSTTLSFLVGGSGSGSDDNYYVFKVDFAGLHERTCGKKDFEEKWPARVDEKGDPSCVMGHKQFFRRRKADADCVIDEDFKDPEPIYETCECTKADFECDFNFERTADRQECLPSSALPVPENACKNTGDTYTGSSGWRLIPGNVCKGGVNLAKEIERPCSDTVKKPASGKVSAEKTPFQASTFAQWYYIERNTRTGSGADETIIMLTSEEDIYITRDHGKTWAPILEGKYITGIVPNPHYHDRVYFTTTTDTVYYTIDRGDNFDSFKVPNPMSLNRLPVLKFHPDYKDWLLWAGEERSRSRTNVYYTKDRGDNWSTLVRGARKCDYIHRMDKDELIFCEKYQNEDPESQNLQLLTSENFFADDQLIYEDILDFATMNEFIIVAQKTEDKQGLQVDASVDGRNFAQAHFPRNFEVKHQQAYTVMDSSTHAVFLHVTVNPNPGREYGTIIKSNSNGTNYVKVMDNVNRDTPGFVDFEKMPGLEGVAMINVVANVDDVNNGEKKKLKSMISHNDGSDWTLLPPPKQDAEGRNYKCVKEDQKAADDCSLHLHSYTERTDKTATFGSPTAVGLMIAVGNVGSQLERKDGESTDTFITTDAGITWQSIRKGSYMWEYGDQGSIIVIVQERKPTRSVLYSLDEGKTWLDFEFSPDVDMEIDYITTVPSDTSRNFLLWGREVGPGNAGGIATVNLDFSGLEERHEKCVLNDEDPANSPDFYLWEPRHPFQSDNCLFGHVAQYHRKKADRNCYIGDQVEDGPHAIVKTCTCSRQDFECDYNYQRLSDGTCELVPGYEKPDHSAVCDNKGTAIWWEPTGYRRIPLSTCEGGQELDRIVEQPCPGYEGEFAKKHGLGGFAIFLILLFSAGAAGGVGYLVWDQYNKRGGLAGMGFGQIRLGESLSGAIPGGAARSSGESPFITIPVAIIAGVVAVGKALPLLVTSIFRSAKGYVPVGSGSRGGYSTGPYRSRDAFANRRQDYSDPAFIEDDELLGDDDDEV